ncbi:unnamed protein product, partial [Musa acuminata subsp. burmannicoides]
RRGGGSCGRCRSRWEGDESVRCVRDSPIASPIVLSCLERAIEAGGRKKAIGSSRRREDADVGRRKLVVG